MLTAGLWVIPGMPRNALQCCLILAGLLPNVSTRLFIGRMFRRLWRATRSNVNVEINQRLPGQRRNALIATKLL